jgi:hypothetical protein
VPGTEHLVSCFWACRCLGIGQTRLFQAWLQTELRSVSCISRPLILCLVRAGPCDSGKGADRLCRSPVPPKAKLQTCSVWLGLPWRKRSDGWLKPSNVTGTRNSSTPFMFWKITWQEGRRNWKQCLILPSYTALCAPSIPFPVIESSQPQMPLGRGPQMSYGKDCGFSYVVSVYSGFENSIFSSS